MTNFLPSQNIANAYSKLSENDKKEIMTVRMRYQNLSEELFQNGRDLTKEELSRLNSAFIKFKMIELEKISALV